MASTFFLDPLPKEPLCAGDQIFYYRKIVIAGRKQDGHCALILKIKMDNRFPVLSLDNNKYVPFDQSVNILSRDAGEFQAIEDYHIIPSELLPDCLYSMYHKNIGKFIEKRQK